MSFLLDAALRAQSRSAVAFLSLWRIRINTHLLTCRGRHEGAGRSGGATPAPVDFREKMLSTTRWSLCIGVIQKLWPRQPSSH